MNNIPEISCIYKIVSPTGKIYIGQTTNANKRYCTYRKKNCKRQLKLYNSIVKYGWESHIFEIIHICPESDLNEMEVFYIKEYNSFNTKHGLNLLSGGNHPKVSNETKEKISKSSKGNTKWLGKRHTEESINKMRISHSGHTTSNETKTKMSLTRKGRIPWNKGIGHSDETKLKMRLSAPKSHSKEHVINQANANMRNRINNTK
jgi:group I intron endonuclease